MTPKQTAVLGWVQKGLSNKQIAQRLGITESTVKIHMTALLKIHAVQTRQQLALYSLGDTAPTLPELEETPYAYIKHTDNFTGVSFGSQPDNTWIAVYKK